MRSPGKRTWTYLRKLGIDRSVDESRRDFVPEVSAVAEARHFTRQVLTDWGISPDDVVLVVSELAANALQHTRSQFTVSLSKQEDAVLVEVTDSGSDLPVFVSAPRIAVSGRGLLIVDRLSRVWERAGPAKEAKRSGSRWKPASEGYSQQSAIMPYLLGWTFYRKGTVDLEDVKHTHDPAARASQEHRRPQGPSVPGDVQ